MWTYQQSKGVLMLDDKCVCDTGYSGHGAGLNCNTMQHVPDVGPIPCGTYTIGPAEDNRHLGPCAMPLTQTHGQSFGRSGFFMHGDNASGDESASEGCIILPRDVRNMVAASPDRTLTVIP